MKKTVIFVAVCAAGIALLTPGCSKKGKPVPNSSNGAGGSSANTPAAGATELKLKWQTGKHYDMEMDLNQSSDVDTPNQPTHTDLKLTQGFHYSLLKDMPDGGSQVEMEFDRQNFDLTQNDKEIINYDSTQNAPVADNGPAGAVAKAMKAMLDVPIDYTLAPDGTVESIDGTNELMNRIKAAVPNMRMRMQLDQMYNEDTLKRYVEFAQSLPDHPVSTGDSWPINQEIKNPIGVLVVHVVNTFKDVEQHNGHDCVHISITGDIKTKTASASRVGAVVNIKKGAITGDAWFDPDLGMFVDIISDQDLTLDIKTRTMALTQHQTEHVEMSLLDVSP